ncbi:modified peptide precursor CbpA [Aromatoleum diolicum]|uniref:Modified peptide CbpA n=1 Tax=Aromatoleum diolicum TaxID=75796 RepID=A0ABX1QJ50_9RHOO|nr:modified peptide precursor CbpA [Aromatoleum diolicum]NMG77566.1 modified peptide precursor CbpA [Aromatoleum diolicum]
MKQSVENGLVIAAELAAGQADASAKPKVIATRKRCEADGVGLSHYILMDRKAGK